MVKHSKPFIGFAFQILAARPGFCLRLCYRICDFFLTIWGLKVGNPLSLFRFEVLLKETLELINIARSCLKLWRKVRGSNPQSQSYLDHLFEEQKHAVDLKIALTTSM